ncbi:MAG TPA: hypothetical protein VE046_02190 [Steroidobacteraceae bacterium]|nr:hypothetical protein [Steroidobacteraceae bacterium]
MSALRSVSIILAMSLATVAVAEEFDGSKPLECTVDKGHNCLPTETGCSPLKPETNIAPVFKIDFAKQEVRSPYRTALLPVVNWSSNREALVLQGADLMFAWSALINKKTGAFTVSTADRKGGYIAFGQCKLAKAS